MKNLKLLFIAGIIISVANRGLYAQDVAATNTAATAPSSTPAATEEEVKKDEPSFKFSGSIDTYFHASLNTEDAAPGTSFANLKGFSLGMLDLIASYGGEKAGFTADIILGPRGIESIFGSASGQKIINQMFAYVKLSKAVTLNMGQFNTFVGMETITPVPNTHYSTSYLFTNGPFNHTGLRMDIATESGFGAKLSVMNPTDIVEFNPVGTYTIGGQLGITKDNGGAWFNLLAGDPDGNSEGDPTNVYGNLLQLDLTTGWNLSEKFYLGFNGSYRTLPFEESSTGDATSFMGVALYPKLTLSENFALGLRLEQFMAKNGYPVVGPFGLDADGNGSVTAFTLSGNYTVGGLRIIPEFRLDNMKENAFLKKDSTSPTPDSKSMATFNLAAVYQF